MGGWWIARIDGWEDGGWVDGKMGGWEVGIINRWINGWMGEQFYGSVSMG